MEATEKIRAFKKAYLGEDTHKLVTITNVAPART